MRITGNTRLPFRRAAKHRYLTSNHGVPLCPNFGLQSGGQQKSFALPSFPLWLAARGAPITLAEVGFRRRVAKTTSRGQFFHRVLNFLGCPAEGRHTAQYKGAFGKIAVVLFWLDFVKVPGKHPPLTVSLKSSPNRKKMKFSTSGECSDIQNNKGFSISEKPCSTENLNKREKRN